MDYYQDVIDVVVQLKNYEQKQNNTIQPKKR